MTETIYYHYVGGPVGDFLVAGKDRALHSTGFSSGRQRRAPEPDWCADPVPLAYALPQFQAYFAGEPVDFDIPLALSGTAFQIEVWRALREVKFGQTASYGAIAARLGKPGSSRAVGAANAANRLPIVVPCHRIIGSNGSLTGFGGGLETKRILLRLEGTAADSAQAYLFDSL